MARFSKPKKAIDFLIKHGMSGEEIAADVPCGRTTIWRMQREIGTSREILRERLETMAKARALNIKRTGRSATNKCRPG